MSTVGERLHLLYEVNRELTSFTALDGLLRYVTQRARELFDAEGCALLLLDRQRREFYFPVASQDEAHRRSGARLREIRFPAGRGIAGWVLTHGEAAAVPDVSKDARFYAGVDQQTSMTTRALLAAPLRTSSGIIGVIEVINPAASALTTEDLEFLATLGGDIAVACEKARLFGNLRGELQGLRQVMRVAGFSLMVAGVLCILGATISHFAWALPVSELATRPGIWMGLAGLGVGVVLVAIERGWPEAK
jgi:GAF domain-containing protein